MGMRFKLRGGFRETGSGPSVCRPGRQPNRRPGRLRVHLQFAVALGIQLRQSRRLKVAQMWLAQPGWRLSLFWALVPVGPLVAPPGGRCGKRIGMGTELFFKGSSDRAEPGNVHTSPSSPIARLPAREAPCLGSSDRVERTGRARHVSGLSPVASAGSRPSQPPCALHHRHDYRCRPAPPSPAAAALFVHHRRPSGSKGPNPSPGGTVAQACRSTHLWQGQEQSQSPESNTLRPGPGGGGGSESCRLQARPRTVSRLSCRALLGPGRRSRIRAAAD